MTDKYQRTLSGSWSCKECGAVVADFRVHTDWHDELREVFRAFLPIQEPDHPPTTPDDIAKALGG